MRISKYLVELLKFGVVNPFLTYFIQKSFHNNIPTTFSWPTNVFIFKTPVGTTGVFRILLCGCVCLSVYKTFYNQFYRQHSRGV